MNQKRQTLKTPAEKPAAEKPGQKNPAAAGAAHKPQTKISSRLMRSKKSRAKARARLPGQADSPAEEAASRALRSAAPPDKKQAREQTAAASKTGAYAGQPKQKSKKGADQAAVKELEEKLKKAQNDYLYLKADFENCRRQALKEQRELALYGGRELIRALAEEALDDLDRSLDGHGPEVSYESFKAGLKLARKNLRQALARFGVRVIDPSGSPFDPESHEAMGREQTSKVPEGHVSAALKKVYKMHDKVIRPALVIVAEKPGKKTS